MVHIAATIIQMFFGCGDASQTINTDIDQVILCNNQKHNDTTSTTPLGNSAFDSKTLENRFIYKTKNYSIEILRTDLSSFIAHQIECQQNDSAIISQFAHTFSIVNLNCKADKYTKNDSIIIEKSIINFAKQKRIILRKNGDNNIRPYTVSNVSYGYSMCSGVIPMYDELSDLTPHTPQKRIKGKRIAHFESFPFTSDRIVSSFDRWENGGYNPENTTDEIILYRPFIGAIYYESFNPEINSFGRESEERFPYTNDSISIDKY